MPIAEVIFENFLISDLRHPVFPQLEYNYLLAALCQLKYSGAIFINMEIVSPDGDERVISGN
jgi:hypothetical protein